MIIKKVTLRNFRNYEQLTIEFDQGIQMLLGKNGKGKTNFLESIYFLSCMRSHRVKDNIDLIQKGKSFFSIEMEIISPKQKQTLKCIVTNKGKNLYIQRTNIKKVSDFIGQLNAVLFCPSDMKLFTASPKVRRMFIDLELGKLSKQYTKTLNEYYRLLKERNAFLKKEDVDLKYLQVLNDQMIESQCIIIEQRTKYCEDLIKHAQTYFQQLDKENHLLSCDYLSFVKYQSWDKMKADMLVKYDRSLERDLFYKNTEVGIHKDDFLFKMDGQDVDCYASQGQTRSYLLALKFGIAKTVQEIKHNYPVILLDDVFSELDDVHRHQLLSLLASEFKDAQIFITSTEKIILDHANVHYFLVDQGNIIEAKEEESWKN